MRFIVLLLVVAPAFVSAQEYSAENIPQELKDHATVVIRRYDTYFAVHDIGTATKKVKKVITILNETAKSHASEYVHYDKNTKVKNLKASLYDKNGKFIRSLKKSEILDESSVSGFSIYEDDRVKILKMSYPSYPFTVEYEYEVTINGLMFYPRWYPQYQSKVSVQNATLDILIPGNIDLRYVETKMPLSVKIKNENGVKQYRWALNNIPAFKPEPYGPALSEIVPSVITAPDRFEMGGYTGSMKSWKDIGLWQNQLNEGLNDVPEATTKEILQITKGKTEKEAIRAVYEYMQNRTRYVSIQLGIGGWQPFSATYVDENGYGDCKALTNYTKSLLEVADIKSIYTLVRAGRNEPNIRTDFPSRQFNHVILAVPTRSDTVWLECTSQTNPFGYAGFFTGDRDVLLITDDGGVVTHTPVYDLYDNVQSSKGIVTLGTDGIAKATFHTSYKGLQYENRDHQIMNSQEEQRKWLYKNLKLNDFDILNVSYIEHKNEIPMIEEDVEIKLKNPVAFSGKRMFFKPNLFNRRDSWPKEVENRTQDVVTTISYQDIDSIQYEFPDGVYVEYDPESVTIDTDFGSYDMQCTVDETGLLYVRKMIFKKGRFKPEKYPEFVEFLKRISKADNTKVVLKKST